MRTSLRFFHNLLVAGTLLLGLAGPAQGQQPALRRAYLTTDPGQDSLFRPGNILTLEVSGLPTGPAGIAAAQHLTLYLNGIPLPGLAPLAVYSGADSAAPAAASRVTALPAASTAAADWPEAAASSDSIATAGPTSRPDALAPTAAGLTHVVVALQRAAAPGYWALADGPPWQAAHPVRLGLGSPTQLLTELEKGKGRTIQLAPVQGWWVGLALAALAGIGLVVLAARSWLLRAPVATATDADGYLLPVAEAAPPYSLARAQLAWWSFLVLGGGLVSGCATGMLPALPTATLALLGVSAGTAALAALAPSRPAASSDEPTPPPQSQGWLADLLSDGRGLAMQRLQLVLVCLALGGSLVWTVYETGVLPAWPPAPALLLAFSSLAYLGPKWRWRGRPAAPAPVAYPVPVAWAAPVAGPPPAVAAAGPYPAASPGPVVSPAWVAPVPVPGAAAASQLQPPQPPAAPPMPVAPARPAPAEVPTAAAAPPPVAESVSAVGVPAVVLAAPLAVATEPEMEPDEAAEMEFSSRSRANPETGEVLYHEEEDMGPLDEDDYPSWSVGD